MSLRLPVLLFLLSAGMAPAQDRVTLLRDTSRLGVSLHRYQHRFPPALPTYVEAGRPRQRGLFDRQPGLFLDSVQARQRAFVRFRDRQQKQRLPTGLTADIQAFVRSDGQYERVFCRFNTDTLSSEQELTSLNLLGSWYASHPFGFQTPSGFYYRTQLPLGPAASVRTIRRGPGYINTLAQARQTNRPDTVTVLALNQLELARIPEEVYRFQNLTELDLSRNQLTNLPARLTAHLPRLQRLSLLYNRLVDDSVAFTPNRQLLALNLQGNQLTRVPPTVRANRALESLWLGNNSLTRLDTRPLRRLRRLTDLNLYNAGLTALPRTIRQLKRLTVLDLYYNKLTALPRQIGQLRRLEQLALSYNELSALPGRLRRLTRLQTLYVHHNRISTLPPDLHRLRQLNTLDISHNWFTVPPPQLGQLPALVELSLNNNNLQEFPMVLTSLPALRKVFLSSNPVVAPDALQRATGPLIRGLEARQVQVFY